MDAFLDSINSSPSFSTTPSPWNTVLSNAVLQRGLSICTSITSVELSFDDLICPHFKVTGSIGGKNVKLHKLLFLGNFSSDRFQLFTVVMYMENVTHFGFYFKYPSLSYIHPCGFFWAAVVLLSAQNEDSATFSPSSVQVVVMLAFFFFF